MQLASLRPRRGKRNLKLPVAAKRIAGLIDGPVPDAVADLLADLYGDALGRILTLIADAPDGAQILESVCADALVGGLLVVHDLHPHSLARRVAGALAGVAPVAAAAEVERIEDGVLYLRLGAPISLLERTMLVDAIGAAAPEISRICTGSGLADEHVLLA